MFKEQWIGAELTKLKRQIIRIDEEKCDGCGLCIPSCPEGALAIVDGKAKVVRDDFCDGLGACLGDCPLDALHVVEEVVDAYDEQGVMEHLRKTAPDKVEQHQQHLQAHGMAAAVAKPEPVAGGCPSAVTMAWNEEKQETAAPVKSESALRQWPVQLHLVSPQAPYFQNADLVLVADCVPFAYPDFHQDWLHDRAVVVCCPKLDDLTGYLEKITAIIAIGKPRRVTVLHMEVPCCGGIVQLARQSMVKAAEARAETMKIPFQSIRIGIKGEVQEVV